MLAILTTTPEEVIDNLSCYFLINNNSYVLLTSEDIDNNFDIWSNSYDACNVSIGTNQKVAFHLPFVVATSNNDIINELESNFIVKVLNEIPDIQEISPILIDLGFLPLDTDIIINYRDQRIDSSLMEKQQVIEFFKLLGYINDSYSPTEKLTYTLLNNEETKRYGEILILISNNQQLDIMDNRYIDFMFEILKFIDINIHSAILNIPVEQEYNNFDDSNRIIL